MTVFASQRVLEASPVPVLKVPPYTGTPGYPPSPSKIKLATQEPVQVEGIMEVMFPTESIPESFACHQGLGFVMVTVELSVHLCAPLIITLEPIVVLPGLAPETKVE